MDNTYITSDLHFYHKNICKYCKDSRGQYINDIETMNEIILQQFDKLPRNATVYNLGDLMLNSNKHLSDLEKLVSRMKSNNKKLILVMGNHDRKLHKRKFLKGGNAYSNSYELLKNIGFDEVYQYPILLEEKYLLSHEPVYLSKGSNLINIHGHTHDIDIDENYFNREFENWAMLKRVDQANQTNLISTEVIRHDKEINLDNYFNICWDKHTRILNIKEIIL